MLVPWETEIDTPATIAVIGSGPIALEAALYARFLGYFVQIFESGKLSQQFRRWQETSLQTPFAELSTSLARAAIEAQAEGAPLPASDSVLTAQQYVDCYLKPLAKTDLLYENIQVHSRVVSVSRIQWRRESRGDIQDRADDEFRLLILSKKRGWYSVRADIVLDASGCCDRQSLGPGGSLAIGEIEEESETETGLLQPNQAQEKCANKRIVLYGASLEAICNASILADLVRRCPETRVTWCMPIEPGCSQPADQLSRLASANPVAASVMNSPLLTDAIQGNITGLGVVPVAGIEKMTRSASGLQVTLQTDEVSTVDIDCDFLVASTGTRPNWDHARALSLGTSPSLERPVWNETGSEFSLQGMPSQGTESLELSQSFFTREPHYYVLGSKSFGLSHPRFTLAQGYQQIRDVFGCIGGRAELDLYAQFNRS